MKVSSVRINSNSTAAVAVINRNLSSAVGAMANAIQKNAAVLAPKKSKTMANSGQVTGSGLERKITFGGSSVARNGRGYDYTRVQEAGGYGSVVFSNYTTPRTGAHFLETAAKAVVQQGIRPYLKKDNSVLAKGFDIHDYFITS